MTRHFFSCLYAATLSYVWLWGAASSNAQDNSSVPALSLSQYERQILHDRLFQTNLRGPRWTGNENQNVLITLVQTWMQHAGLETELLTYNFLKWDPRWWSLSLTLTNGTKVGLPTTGYWPYSGNSGPGGVTSQVVDVGTYGINDTIAQNSVNATLQMDKVRNLNEGGSIIFFDNPSPTRNYSLPGYKVLGTGRDIPESDIPELGNLTNPHWQSAKALNFTQMKEQGVVGIISQWVNVSDENAALQFLPNEGPVSSDEPYDVPSVYVGEGTGRTIRGLLEEGSVSNATIVLDAPWSDGTTETIHAHLAGTGGGNDTILVYTHSDGPTIIEENGPILLLTIAEYFAQHRPSINLDFVVTTGHMSGHILNEELWMEERPQILQNAKAAVVCEHFGAKEWKDVFDENGVPTYVESGDLEPMWTMVNDTDTDGNTLVHEIYHDSFEGTSDNLRMAMISPQLVGDYRSKWYGAGGSGTLGRSGLPTVGIIPQPDYLWASFPDGGWSKMDFPTVVEQIEVILRFISGLDEAVQEGDL